MTVQAVHLKKGNLKTSVVAECHFHDVADHNAMMRLSLFAVQERKAKRNKLRDTLQVLDRHEALPRCRLKSTGERLASINCAVQALSDPGDGTHPAAPAVVSPI